jgi:hypothetical protein
MKGLGRIKTEGGNKAHQHDFTHRVRSWYIKRLDTLKIGNKVEMRGIQWH